MEVSVVRRRVVETIERSKRAAAERRAANEAAGRAWDDLREAVVVPLCRTVAQVLRSEGYQFGVATPGTTVRLVSDRSSEDRIEFGLDTHGSGPVLLCSVQRTRGREVFADERPVRAGVPVTEVSDEDVLAVLLEVLGPFVER
jgi:hypothetical protein